MNKDFENLASAYSFICEGKKKDVVGKDMHVIAALRAEIKNCKSDKEKQKLQVKLSKYTGEVIKSGGKDKLKEAYEQILEASATDKVVNKKLARRYYKVVRSLLKAEHGSKDYQKLKDEKEDIVKIVSDHGKSIADLDDLLTKKEKEEVAEEGGEDNKVNAKICTMCGGDHDSSSCPEDGHTPA
jgi:hypothetical protein